MMTAIIAGRAGRRRSRIRAPGRSVTLRLTDMVLRWQERASQRHHLRGLSDTMLRDIGITRADVEFETSKPFWRN